MDNWPTQKDKVLLHEAAVTRKQSVVFSDGRRYSIRREKKKSIAWGEYDVVFIQPEEGPLIPCGWFHVKFLLANNDGS